MDGMKSLFPFRLFAEAPEDADAPVGSPYVVSDAVSSEPEAGDADHRGGVESRGHEGEEEQKTPLIKTIAWITAGAGAVALGLVVGRELRQRYKFNRRTPYDFYAHAGDEQDLEFGVGI
jgi:hypothetical protein